MAGASGEVKGLSLLLQHEAKHGKIDLGRHTFCASKDVKRARFLSRQGGIGITRGCSQTLDLSRQRVNRTLKAVLFASVAVLARCAQQAVARILHLAGDDLPRNARALWGIIGSTELPPPQGHAGVSHTRHARLELPVLAQEI
jgi:hypothetical protein